jgi:nucleoside-diphosphate-sugar epimerase
MTPRIGITGAAGLVGQNLIPRLKRLKLTNIVAIDKHPANTATLRRLHPDIGVIEVDLAHDDGWQPAIAGCDVVVCAHAQIGGLDRTEFEDNNVLATKRLLDVVKTNARAHVIHISSSVVESAASDWYVSTKHSQEELVVNAGISYVVLRPTLMFGWFDRKHIGWLVRFMHRIPVFPIPGHGRYLRQPLYVGDFCEIIISCMAHRLNGAAYNISGQESVSYIDLMRMVRDVCNSRTIIVPIPYWLFWSLLKLYSIFDQHTPFTTDQLKALVTPDFFEVIDWPRIFGVTVTPLHLALKQSYCDPVYSQIVLEF